MKFFNPKFLIKSVITFDHTIHKIVQQFHETLWKMVFKVYVWFHVKQKLELDFISRKICESLDPLCIILQCRSRGFYYLLLWVLKHTWTGLNCRHPFKFCASGRVQYTVGSKSFVKLPKCNSDKKLAFQTIFVKIMNFI